MYLSKISIKDFRMFSDVVEVSFSKGLNLLVGENGSGKSSVVDAIRALLGENEFSRRGIIEEDFYSVFCESQKKSSESLFISGVFSNLTEHRKLSTCLGWTKTLMLSLVLKFSGHLTEETIINKKDGVGILLILSLILNR